LLLDQLHPWLASQPEMRPGRAAACEAFIHRARHHLHIVFATSPAGTAFRTRCRQFPSLVNCMTIDWFSPWPAEALLGVGVRVLEGLDLGPGAGASSESGAAAAAGAMAVAGSVQQSVVTRVARMCVDIHKGVEAAADRLHQEQQRR
jgi:dynein heavy chain